MPTSKLLISLVVTIVPILFFYIMLRREENRAKNITKKEKVDLRQIEQDIYERDYVARELDKAKNESQLPGDKEIIEKKIKYLKDNYADIQKN